MLYVSKKQKENPDAGPDENPGAGEIVPETLWGDTGTLYQLVDQLPTEPLRCVIHEGWYHEEVREKFSRFI